MSQETSVNQSSVSIPKLPAALLSLRLGVFIVMLMWTLDKFVNPTHAATVFAKFYKLEGLGTTVLYVIAGLEVLLILAFVAGLAKKWTYGAVFLLHAVSTLSSWKQYLGFDNLLFFAAWPMLAACYALFVLREHDTLMTVSGSRGSGMPQGS